MSKSVSLGTFPKLCTRSEDVAASFKEWLEEFEIVMRTRAWELGTEVRNVDGQQLEVSRFSPEAKRLALINCIGREGRQVLTASGLDVRSEQLDYDAALEVLQRHFGRGDNKYLQIHNITHTRQSAGEDYSSYLRRIELQSRSLVMFTHPNDIEKHKDRQELRSEFALALAVTGLRDKALCKELIARDDLTWSMLSKLLASRSAAEETMMQLHGTSSIVNEVVKVKAKACVVKSKNRRSLSPTSTDYYNSNSRDSSHSSRSNLSYKRERVYPYSKRSDNYGKRGRSTSGDRSSGSESRMSERRSVKRGESSRCYECGQSGHAIRDCPEARCYRCGERGHLADRCRRRRCTGCGERHRGSERCSTRHSREQSPSWRKSREHQINLVERDSFNSWLYERNNHSRVDNRFIRTFEVNGEAVEFTIDTGADVTVLTERTGRRLNLNYSRPKRVLVAANGADLNVLGESRVNISNNGIYSRAKVFICEGASTNLLGKPQIEELELLESRSAPSRQEKDDVRAAVAASAAMPRPVCAAPVFSISGTMQAMKEITEGLVYQPTEEDLMAELSETADAPRRAWEEYERKVRAIHERKHHLEQELTSSRRMRELYPELAGRARRRSGLRPGTGKAKVPSTEGANPGTSTVSGNASLRTSSDRPTDHVADREVKEDRVNPVESGGTAEAAAPVQELPVPPREELPGLKPGASEWISSEMVVDCDKEERLGGPSSAEVLDRRGAIRTSRGRSQRRQRREREGTTSRCLS
jgi:hypothetical protein